MRRDFSCEKKAKLLYRRAIWGKTCWNTPPNKGFSAAVVPPGSFGNRRFTAPQHSRLRGRSVNFRAWAGRTATPDNNN
jgi:hypothetical protein